MNRENENIKNQHQSNGQMQDESNFKENDSAGENNVDNENVSEEEALPSHQEDELVNWEEKATEWEDKYIRLYAEFQNYKNRVSKDRLELIKSAGEDIISSILPVLDDFDRALKNIENTDDIEMVKEGYRLIHKKLHDTLQKKGLKEIEVSPGDALNYELHNAVAQIPAPSEDLKGKIVDVVEKGYTLNGKIIRHAKVVIGQ